MRLGLPNLSGIEYISKMRINIGLLIFFAICTHCKAMNVDDNKRPRPSSPILNRVAVFDTNVCIDAYNIIAELKLIDDTKKFADLWKGLNNEQIDLAADHM